MKKVHPEFLHFQQEVHAALGKMCENIVLDAESQDYGAASCLLNNTTILFRVAKTTPTKTGQFVTLWKRGNPAIEPFDLSDPIDYVVIGVSSQDRRGYFIFPKKILCEKKVFSVNHRGGKRAMRVYAPWDEANSRQAQQTKSWQALYFSRGDSLSALLS